MQSAMMQILYKGIFRWFLKLIVGVQFPDTRFPPKGRTIHHPCQSQQPSGYTQPAFFPTRQPFVENKTRSRGRLLRKNRFQAAFSNYFINTLLIRRKGERTRSTTHSGKCSMPSMKDTR